MKEKKRPKIQGAKWRKLDNTAKLFAAVAGEDLSNVFRLSAVLREDIDPELLQEVLNAALPEFEHFRVKMRKGFFWNYFETNNREPLVEKEDTYPCKYIDPHASHRFPFRVSYYGKRMNLEVFHGLTDGLGALNFLRRLTERYLELSGERREKGAQAGNVMPEAAGVPAAEPGDAGTGAVGQRDGGAGDAEPGDTVIRAAGQGEAEAKAAESQDAEAGAVGRVAAAGTGAWKEAEARDNRRADTAVDAAAQGGMVTGAVGQDGGGARAGGHTEDGYLRYYKKRPHRRYETKAAMQIKGQCLPLDWQSVLYGSVGLAELKALCKREGVSITKYLTAVLLWSIIQVYSDGKKLKRPAAVNLPINLRSFFDSETMANFFAVTNIAWPEGRAPERFEEVLAEVGRQMDEKIVKDKLEETISYNVSNEKKWYVRLVPLFIKNIAMNAIFLKSSRAYTMTLSNLGPVAVRPELKESVDEFQVLLGVSGRQRMKCGVIAYGDRISISFNSAMTDTKLQDYFFRFLEERGAAAKLESNGVVERRYYRGTYPEISHDRGKLKKLVNLFYLVLLTAAAITGIVNLATYELAQTWWSLISIGGIAYVAMTVRYSIMRRASLAGILVRQSLGVQVLLILIDYMTGFHGWSVNYAIPSLILFDVIAVVFMILLNRLNWQSYFMYQIAITVFSFIPLIFWAVGWTTRPFMSVLAVILSVAVLAVTVILGDRSVKKELKRRFYF